MKSFADTSKINKTESALNQLQSRIKNEVTRLRRTLKSLPRGRHLINTNDYGAIHFADLEDGCNFEQIRNLGSDGVLGLSRNIKRLSVSMNHVYKMMPDELPDYNSKPRLKLCHSGIFRPCCSLFN